MLTQTFDNASSPQAAPAPAKTLAQRVEEAHAFFDPQNLADIILQYDEREVGLLVIDVQKKYCYSGYAHGSEETETVSERIQSLAPEFRKAGAPVYAVYFDTPKANASEIDFYKFSPEPEDTLVAKHDMSAFLGGDIRKILDKDHRKLLLVCGVYLNHCVRETVQDAAALGYDVLLLRDLTGDYKTDTGDTEKNLGYMKNQGIAVVQSGQALQALKIANNARHVMKGNAP